MLAHVVLRGADIQHVTGCIWTQMQHTRFKEIFDLYSKLPETVGRVKSPDQKAGGSGGVGSKRSVRDRVLESLARCVCQVMKQSQLDTDALYMSFVNKQ